MKRSLCIFLILVLLLGTAGCRQDQPKIMKPVSFYYPRLEPTYGAADSMIASVSAEGAGYETDPAALLNVYLRGPSDPAFTSPFPQSVSLLTLAVENTEVRLELSDTFAQLTGMELTLACACLAMTAMELTGTDSTRISAADSTLDGASFILMDRSCMTLLDTYVPETT